MNVQGYNPTMAAPVQGQSAHAAAATSSSSGSSSSSSSATSASSLSDTFLNLLVTELQNQDPTSPVDPTQMVSQMVSLNQLDQLININQTLSGLTAAPTASSDAKASTAQAASSLAGTPLATPTTSSAATAAALNQLQPGFTGLSNPTALMNLYGSIGAPTATSNSTLSGGR